MPQNPYQLAMQGLQQPLNIPDPRNKMPRRYDPSQGQQIIPSTESPGMTGSANEPLDAWNAGLDMQDELEMNLANTPQTDSYAVDRLKGLLKNNQRGLESSFIPEQAAQVNQFNLGNAEAANQGFGQGGSTPTTSGQSALQSREIYKRGIAEEEMRQPLERVREQSRGLIGQAKQGADVKREGYDLLNRTLQGGQVPPGGSMSISGVGSVRIPQANNAPPNAAFESIQNARQQYEFAKQQAPDSKPGTLSRMFSPSEWGQEDQLGPRKKALDDAVQAYLGQYKSTNPLAKSMAAEFYKNPEAENLSAEDIIYSMMQDAPENIDLLGEEGLIELEEMLRTILGR